MLNVTYMRPKFIGITGTNGKTTTTYLVQSILQTAGLSCAVIGTLSGRLTTPSPWHLKRLIRRYARHGYDWISMEVSSHGIHQNRIKGIHYDVKALTNITQDHLDYHKTMEEYRKVKLDWFFGGDCLRVSFFENLVPHPDPSSPRAIPKSFYEQNRQLAAEICRQIGVSEDNIQKGLANAPQVPGRFEYIDCGQPFKVIIDYAHTPDGLEKILKESHLLLDKHEPRPRLIALFGCGGDRDKTKRPIMGALAARLAEIVIVTTDNPRSEDPQTIIEEILEGIPNRQELLDNLSLFPEVDRAVAIKKALSLAKPNDVVVLAGKGHETYQIFKNETIHFSDKEEVVKHFSQ